MEEYPDFETTCGYGSVTGILGANCRHNFTPFIPGVMERTYTDEQLANIDPPPFEYEGKTYTHYEATQKQREIERTVRKWKRREAAATTKEDKQACQIRIKRLQSKYKEFSKAANLRTQPERMSVYVPVVRNEIVTSTPIKADAVSFDYKDATAEWYKSATPYLHYTEDAKEFIQDGVKYTVDGANVKFEYSAREEAVARILQGQFGGQLYMMPKVQGDYKNISTPDYLFRGGRYDLKTVTSNQADAFHNAIHKKIKQADNFIIDFEPSGISDSAAISQAAEIFKKKSTAFVNRIILIRGKKVICVLERK